MKWDMARLGVAAAAILGVHAVLVGAFFGGPQPVRTADGRTSVVVQEPEKSVWFQEEKKRLEEEVKKVEEEQKKQEEDRKRLEEERRDLAEKQKAFEEQVKRLEQVAEMAGPQEAAMRAREEAAERIEQELAKVREEAGRREALAEKQEKDLEARESKAVAERGDLDKRQKEIGDLAKTLVDRQTEQAAEKQALERSKAEVAAREKAAEALARELLAKQNEILAKQKALEEAQKGLAETETQRDQEWERIKDEWNKIETQRQAIEKKLASTETTQAEWRKLQAEWQKLDQERKALEEEKQVKEDVDRFRRGFDRDAYEQGLAGLKASLNRKGLKDGFIPFDFKFTSEKDLAGHLQYFGIVDLYMNESSFLVVENYGAGFGRKGSLGDKAFSNEIAEKYLFGINRLTHPFYSPFIAKAEGTIGKGVHVRGLVPVSVSYEIFYHKKRILETLGLPEKDLAFFRIAPWRDEAGGRWMFKIIDVRKADGTWIKVGNYHF